MTTAGGMEDVDQALLVELRELRALPETWVVDRQIGAAAHAARDMALCEIVAAAAARESVASAQRARDRRSPWRTPVGVACGVGAVLLLATGSLGSAGELPDPLQRRVARAAEAVGIHLPVPRENETNPETPSAPERVPYSSEPAPPVDQPEAGDSGAGGSGVPGEVAPNEAPIGTAEPSPPFGWPSGPPPGTPSGPPPGTPSGPPPGTPSGPPPGTPSGPPAEAQLGPPG